MLNISDKFKPTWTEKSVSKKCDFRLHNKWIPKYFPVLGTTGEDAIQSLIPCKCAGVLNLRPFKMRQKYGSIILGCEACTVLWGRQCQIRSHNSLQGHLKRKNTPLTAVRRSTVFIDPRHRLLVLQQDCFHIKMYKITSTYSSINTEPLAWIPCCFFE